MAGYERTKDLAYEATEAKGGDLINEKKNKNPEVVGEELVFPTAEADQMIRTAVQKSKAHAKRSKGAADRRILYNLASQLVYVDEITAFG